jgi:MoaA/NifB/PqqE/SkfB family radical SAM enzyme
MKPLALLYRGPLDSCNYACSYCPFAKRDASRRTLERDRASLARFVGWAKQVAGWQLEILFTPYGEALIWPHYQAALVELSRADHVRQVSIQTNASGKLDFLDQADRARVSLWISWHPTEVELEPFARRIAALHEAGTRLSVGAVAVPEHLAAVEALRAALPPAVPMWINAQKPNARYGEAERARWRALDPAFDVDARRHLTRGAACLAGEDTISVSGSGVVTRCHFVDDVLGNLYEDDLETMLWPRPCTRARCDCFIGYSNLPALDLRRTFVDGGRLARIRA